MPPPPIRSQGTLPPGVLPTSVFELFISWIKQRPLGSGVNLLIVREAFQTIGT